MLKSFLRSVLYMFFVFILAGCNSGGDDNEASTPVAPNPVPVKPGYKFEFSGLDGHTIIRFHKDKYENTLYAATDMGLYSLDDVQGWLAISPAEWYVYDVIALYPGHLIASVKVDLDNQLFQSFNNGKSWNVINHNFGGDDRELFGQNEIVQRLMFDDSTGILYATGFGVLAQSDDFGSGWRELSGYWYGISTGMKAMTMDPITKEIWFGGQGAIEDPVLRKYDQNSMHTSEYPEISELLEHPSVVKSIRLFEHQPDRVLISAEGGLIQSQDKGAAWTPVLVNDDSRFYFDVAVDEGSTNRLYTAGWNKNFEDPQPLILEVSLDDGATWQAYEHKDEHLRGGVWSMIIREEGENKVLYLGLCKGGVMKVRLLP